MLPESAETKYFKPGSSPTSHSFLAKFLSGFFGRSEVRAVPEPVTFKIKPLDPH